MTRHAICYDIFTGAMLVTYDYNIGPILVPRRATTVGKNIKTTFASPSRFAIEGKKNRNNGYCQDFCVTRKRNKKRI